MQVQCPNCGAKVSAENINIQKMTAVCTVCDTVFPFELPEAKTKTKWRDVRQPDKLTLRDAETLRMEFATNFRLEKSQGFILGTFGGLGLILLSLLIIAEAKTPGPMPVVFLLMAAALFYWSALTVLNKTHIEMDEDAITIERKPLPSLFDKRHDVPLDGVTAIKYEETAISKKEGYDTPRYRVWAETTAGISRTIVNDVTEEYAVYIAQALQERLYIDSTPEITDLENDDHGPQDDLNVYEVLRESQNSLRS